MRFLWERMKIVVEPSGAVSLAGVLSGQIHVQGKRVGVIISGGNIDLGEFFERLKQKIA
jgi:threonine dehydratase